MKIRYSFLIIISSMVGCGVETSLFSDDVAYVPYTQQQQPKPEEAGAEPISNVLEANKVSNIFDAGTCASSQSSSFIGSCQYNMDTVCVDYFAGDAKSLEDNCLNKPMPGRWSNYPCDTTYTYGGCTTCDFVLWSFPLGGSKFYSDAGTPEAKKECEAKGGAFISPSMNR